jgi:quercetin dioxygenase-like cupin family protein
MQLIEIEDSEIHTLVDIIEYVPNSVVSGTIIQRNTGSIRVIAMDSGVALAEKISPFKTFIQIIEGKADIVIDNNSNILIAGQVILIPAHTTNLIRASKPSKLVITIIKSGYEGIVI